MIYESEFVVLVPTTFYSLSPVELGNMTKFGCVTKDDQNKVSVSENFKT